MNLRIRILATCVNGVISITAVQPVATNPSQQTIIAIVTPERPASRASD